MTKNPILLIENQVVKLGGVKLLLLLILINFNFINSQPILNYSENFFVQKNRMNKYFDSLSFISLNSNQTLKGTGYGEMQRWINYWNLNMHCFL